MQYTYALIDLASISVPLIASFHPRLRFDRQWFAFWPACFITAALFVVWDQTFTQIGVWGFNPRYTFSPRVGDLPLEEIAFFVCIPYASVFTYHCLNVLLPSTHFVRGTAYVPKILIVLLALLFISYYNHLYTACSSALGLVLLSIPRIRKAQWLPLFFRSFVLILIPFFIVNGLLTGTMLDQPVVWYNDNENLGFRMLTIPVDDVLYGMDMLLMTTALYEYFRKRRRM